MTTHLHPVCTSTGEGVEEAIKDAIATAPYCEMRSCLLLILILLAVGSSADEFDDLSSILSTCALDIKEVDPKFKGLKVLEMVAKGNETPTIATPMFKLIKSQMEETQRFVRTFEYMGKAPGLNEAANNKDQKKATELVKIRIVQCHELNKAYGKFRKSIDGTARHSKVIFNDHWKNPLIDVAHFVDELMPLYDKCCKPFETWNAMSEPESTTSQTSTESPTAPPAVASPSTDSSTMSTQEATRTASDSSHFSSTISSTPQSSIPPTSFSPSSPSKSSSKDDDLITSTDTTTGSTTSCICPVPCIKFKCPIRSCCQRFCPRKASCPRRCPNDRGPCQNVSHNDDQMKAKDIKERHDELDLQTTTNTGTGMALSMLSITAVVSALLVMMGNL